VVEAVVPPPPPITPPPPPRNTTSTSSRCLMDLCGAGGQRWRPSWEGLASVPRCRALDRKEQRGRGKTRRRRMR
jgi:hypothetical protein